MTAVETRSQDDVSLLALATAVIAARWRIVRWMIVGAVVAALTTMTKPTVYRSTASFIPKGAESSRSNLASLAGQFGIALQSGSQSLTPDFYAELLRSRSILMRLSADTIAVAEMGGRRMAIGQVIGIDPRTERDRQLVAQSLESMIDASVEKTTGVVSFSVTSRWPSVSAAIAAALVTAVNDFNERMSQGQASAERQFVESQVKTSGEALRQSEDQLETFLRTNRQYAGSPELSLAHDRLQRDVGLKQQVYSSLVQSYQEARIRELRDMPVATMVETPLVPLQPQPRGRLTRLALGVILGGFVGIALALLSWGIDKGQAASDVEINEFVRKVQEARDEAVRGARRLAGRRTV